MGRALSLLRSSRLFRGLDDSFLRSPAKESSLRRYHEGESIFRGGEPAEAFTIINTGLLHIVRRRPTGDAALLAVFGPHESVGDAAVLERAPYPADAVTLSVEADVLAVRAAPVLEAMVRDPGVANALNRALLDHTHALLTKIDIMSAGPVSRRLSVLFDHLAERFGDEIENGAIFIPVSLSRTALAWLIGARSETVIRTLTQWQRESWLVTTKDGFLLKSPEAIRRPTEEVE